MHVYCKEGIKEVRVLNTVGQQISRHQPQNDSNTRHLAFNIQHYPKGLYVTQITTTQGDVWNERLIIE